MQFFNFHNELAYMDADHHEALGFANYACFCCAQPSAIGTHAPTSSFWQQESAPNVFIRLFGCMQAGIL